MKGLRLPDAHAACLPPAPTRWGWVYWINRLTLLALIACFSSCLQLRAQIGAPAATLPATNQTGPVVLPPPDKAPVAPANPQFQFNQPQQTSQPPSTVDPSVPSPPPLNANPFSVPAPNPVVAPPPVATAPPVVAPGAVAPPATTIPKGEEIYDIRPPVFFLHGWVWLWLLLAAFALLSLIVLVWLWFDHRRARPNPLTAYDLALRKIEEARPLMTVEDPAPYAVAVSEAIRTYLTKRFTTPSDRRTTEEFLRHMEADPGTPFAPHRDLLRDFLQACDLLKFAQYRPHAEELERVHQRAVTFVTATKPEPEPESRPRASANLIPRTA